MTLRASPTGQRGEEDAHSGWTFIYTRRTTDENQVSEGVLKLDLSVGGWEGERRGDGWGEEGIICFRGQGWYVLRSRHLNHNRCPPPCSTNCPFGQERVGGVTLGYY